MPSLELAINIERGIHIHGRQSIVYLCASLMCWHFGRIRDHFLEKTLSKQAICERKKNGINAHRIKFVWQQVIYFPKEYYIISS
jgi:hypothetical protein